MLTNDERAALAKLAEGKLTSRSENAGIGGSIYIPAWRFPSYPSGKTLLCSDFHPDTDGRYILMVLEALVVHVGCKQGYSWENVLRDLMWKAHQCYEDEEDFNLGDAVCAAGLEILRKDGT